MARDWERCNRGGGLHYIALSPGSPVITSARCWSDDAPPGERPGRSSGSKDLELLTRSWSNIKKDRELEDHSTVRPYENDGKPRRHGDKVGGGISTSTGTKCKGKYRIRVKGPACECCRGT